MRVTPEELALWIEQGEGRGLEFKRGLPRAERVGRTICAFANTSGGLLLVGVTDRGRVWGVARPREAMRALREVAAAVLDPPVDVVLTSVEVEGRAVVCCSVPLSPHRPHALRRAGGRREVVVRVGSSNRAADGATRRAIARRPEPGSPGPLERRVLAWLARTGGGSGGATVRAFGQAHNVGIQRARRAFVRLERAGRIVGHGRGAGREYELA